MSKPKHTPGPWQIHLGSVVADLRPDPKDPAYDLWNTICDPTNTADAALISSAPELLEALSLIRDRIESWTDSHRIYLKQAESDSIEESRQKNIVRNYVDLLNIMTTAIAKAEGKE